MIQPPDRLDYDASAERVVYLGSPEHKDSPSFAGQPRPRGDAFLCDRALAGEQVEITSWLRDAFRRRAVSAFFEGEFPRYVWYKREGIVFEGRLVNQTTGEYKGYPLEPDEWPRGIEEFYE